MPTVTRLVTVVDIDGDAADPHAMQLSARHDAELADGRRILLLDDRGWGSHNPAQDVWATTTVGEIAETARVVVGPDEPDDDHTHADMAANHWAELARILHHSGVTIDAGDLALLPHEVVLSDRLRERIGASGAEMS